MWLEIIVWHHNAEDHGLDLHCCESLKYHRPCNIEIRPEKTGLGNGNLFELTQVQEWWCHWIFKLGGWFLTCLQFHWSIK
jgi:hypothetical protein